MMAPATTSLVFYPGPLGLELGESYAQTITSRRLEMLALHPDPGRQAPRWSEFGVQYPFYKPSKAKQALSRLPKVPTCRHHIPANSTPTRGKPRNDVGDAPRQSPSRTPTELWLHLTSQSRFGRQAGGRSDAVLLASRARLTEAPARRSVPVRCGPVMC